MSFLHDILHLRTAGLGSKLGSGRCAGEEPSGCEREHLRDFESRTVVLVIARDNLLTPSLARPSERPRLFPRRRLHPSDGDVARLLSRDWL